MKFITSAAAMAILAFTGFATASSTSAELWAPSTTGGCTGTADRCVGDITYFGGGTGACGWYVLLAKVPQKDKLIAYSRYIDTNTDFEIALPEAFMGAQSNDNPFCGKSVTIYNHATGNMISAAVADKCEGCTDRSIDLTETLFSQLTNGDIAAGRVPNVQWWFN